MNRKFTIDLCHPLRLCRARYPWAAAGIGDDYRLMTPVPACERLDAAVAAGYMSYF